MMQVDPQEQYKLMRQTANKLVEGFEKNYESKLDDEQRKLLTNFTMFIYTIQTTKDIAEKLANKNGGQNG